jgi:signal peptidase I
VVFSDPGGWLQDEPVDNPAPWDKALEFIGVPTKSTPGHLIKRIIGIPGDKVVCCNAKGRITVNGQALDESSYLYTDRDGVQVHPSDVKFEVVVPKDRIFVMGDHRDLSADSRCHLSDLSTNEGIGQVAFVPISLVVGPAFAIAAPFDRAGRLRRPSTFAKVPDPSETPPKKAVIKPAGVSC